ncbi:MAG: hypothetical protein H0V17_03735, partial [Deltaproteobacteria bacterium]|nr:hypothetical protein [Deltaproteobacteria bacterium]
MRANKLYLHWLLSITAAACGSKESGTPGTPSGSAVGTGSAPVALAPGTVELFVDEASVAKITKEQIAKWPRLDSLVPDHARRLGTWQTIYLRGKAEKPAELNRPSATYPDMVGALFPGEGGEPAFGMFDPVEL